MEIEHIPKKADAVTEELEILKSGTNENKINEIVAAIAIVAGINVLNAQKDVAYDRVFLTKSSSSSSSYTTIVISWI